MASRVPRLLRTMRRAWRSKGADALRYGPSFTASATRAAPATAMTDDTATSVRQGSPAPIQASRWGTADPIPTAPTTMPSAVPRRSRNHPAAIFMPGG